MKLIRHHFQGIVHFPQVCRDELPRSRHVQNRITIRLPYRCSVQTQIRGRQPIIPFMDGLYLCICLSHGESVSVSCALRSPISTIGRDTKITAHRRISMFTETTVPWYAKNSSTIGGVLYARHHNVWRLWFCSHCFLHIVPWLFLDRVPRRSR